MGSVSHKPQKHSPGRDMTLVALWSLVVCGIIYYLDFKYQIGKKLEINNHDILMITIGVVFFTMLWSIAERVFFAPYIKLIELREQATVGADDIAAGKESEALKLNDQYETKILEARTAGVRLKEKLSGEAKKEANCLVEGAQGEAEQITSKAKREIEQRVRELAAGSKQEAEALAGIMVERILGSEKGVH